MNLSEVKINRQMVLDDAKRKAEEAWKAATDNQKGLIRFGMTDVALLRKSGYDPYGQDPTGERHQFSLALMACATRDGGMRA